jgi:hypothetical protein
MNMLVTEKGQRREMTEFGKTLNKLMVKHDVYQWDQLRERLEDVGYKIGQSRLSQYLYGKRNPRNPQDFFDAIATALRLDEDEKTRLVYSFAYPAGRTSRGGLSQETIDGARAFEERVRAEEEREREGETRREAKGS